MAGLVHLIDWTKSNSTMYINLLYRSQISFKKSALLCGLLWFLHSSISNAQVVINEVYIRPDGLSATPPNGLIYIRAVKSTLRFTIKVVLPLIYRAIL